MLEFVFTCKYHYVTGESCIYMVFAHLLGNRVDQVQTIRKMSSVQLCEHGGLMVSALDSGASAPGSSPGRGHCVVFLGKTLYSHGASLHPGV